MSNVIGFPHGFRGSDNGPVDPPCECDDGVGSILPEGYRLKHFQLPDPKAEPTSSNPFPWFKIITTANECYASVQINKDQMLRIDIDDARALDIIAALGTHLRRTLRPNKS